MNRAIRIGTRGSALALKQTQIVGDALRHINPALAIETRVIQTQGDLNQAPIPLDIVGKGWFTKEIESELLDGSIDIAVHSLKDMAETMPEGLKIGAYLAREDARDVLITKDKSPINTLRPGAIIGTDSIRRQIQMQALRPVVMIKSIRGNVLSRLEKLKSQEYDAIILAAAGLNRLGLEHIITHYFTAEDMTPAPGQGTLAVQMRSDDSELYEMILQLNDADAAHCALIERSFSHAIGGGCKSPTGAYASRNNSDCTLITMFASNPETIMRHTVSAHWDASIDLGTIAAQHFLK